jgi:hypothetical protein
MLELVALCAANSRLGVPTRLHREKNRSNRHVFCTFAYVEFAFADVRERRIEEQEADTVTDETRRG